MAVVLFLLPALLVLGIFRFIPSFMVFINSFQKWGLIGFEKWVGFENYLKLINDPFFWNALVNTFWYSLLSISISIILSLGVASIMLNSRIGGVIKFVVSIPVVISLIPASIVWKWIYNPSSGFLNYLLMVFGLEPLKWLQEHRGIFFGYGPSLALLSVVIMSIWKSFGYNTLILYAGLKSIDKSVYEAAEIDGANSWRVFKDITLPLLSPSLFYVYITSFITSFQVFAPIWVMTGPPPGGPLGTTNVLVYYLYQKGVEDFNIGYASAVAIALLFVVGILTLVQKIFIEKRVYYEI
ncbi:MAG: sugar ABC transporter permease [candidate division WOR-3 bacterium]